MAEGMSAGERSSGEGGPSRDGSSSGGGGGSSRKSAPSMRLEDVIEPPSGGLRRGSFFTSRDGDSDDDSDRTPRRRSSNFAAISSDDGDEGGGGGVGGCGDGGGGGDDSMSLNDIRQINTSLSTHTTDASSASPGFFRQSPPSSRTLAAGGGGLAYRPSLSGSSAPLRGLPGQAQSRPASNPTAVGTRRHAHLKIQEALLTVPHFTRRESALLFVDITGFTRLSTLLEVEALSKAINSYFEMMAEEVIRRGGDVLKFAGDAFFAEWQALPPQEMVGALNPMQEEDTDSLVGRTLSECALAAAACGAAIVEECSDHVIPVDPHALNEEDRNAVLNVHCGLGVGHLVGLHVGDSGDDGDDGGDDAAFKVQRREYLFLGDPIDQAAEAGNMATDGQLIASPQTINLLARTCRMPEDILRAEGPSIIAIRSDFLVKLGLRGCRRPSDFTMVSNRSKISVFENLQVQCDGMDDDALVRLCRQLSLYVHPVVRGDASEWNGHGTGGGSVGGGGGGAPPHGRALASRTRRGYQSRHRAEAELRSVYTMFVTALITAKITGDDVADGRLFETLHGIMTVASREIARFRGHIRQFIVDDKGVVLIATFGLRGSAFPNMVPNNALPATIALHSALKEELDVDNRIGATYGKVYCGVVGGVRRHEFAVMGAPVNLAARLMDSPQNDGIIVDEAVQLQASGQFLFRNLPSIKAKGYSDPVPTFQPLRKTASNRRIHSALYVVRKEQTRRFVEMAEKILDEERPSQTETIFLYGESGTGKSTLLQHVCEDIKECCYSRDKMFVIARSVVAEKEQMVPFSGFRDIFLSAIADFCSFTGTPLGAQSTQTSRRQMFATAGIRSFRMGGLSRTCGISSTASTRSVSHEVQYFSKLRWMCMVLGYEHEYADIIGARLLGLEEADRTVCTINGKTLSLDNMAEFLTRAFVKFTEHSDLTLVVLDDTQWIDSSSWKVICGLVQTGTNLLLLCNLLSHKSMRRMSWLQKMWFSQKAAKPRCTEISLGPFSLSEVRELISRTLGYEEESLEESFVKDVHKQTRGLPVFVAEFLENIKRNCMVEVQEGRVGWRSSIAVKQFLCKMHSSVVFEELFLQRFDSLDSSVRNVLQTCAMLGSAFTIHDIVQVHSDLNHCSAEAALSAAVEQCILLEDIDVDEDAETMTNSAEGQNPGEDPCGNSRTSSSTMWNPFEEKSYRFSHGIWQNCVLKTMLKERRLELHRTIAISIEADTMFDVSDTSKLLLLFEHWKSCGEFGKAAPLALALCSRMEELDSIRQSLDVCHDALNMLEHEHGSESQGKESCLGLKADVIESASLPVLEMIIKLYMEIGRCSSRLRNQEQFFFACRDAYRVLVKSSKSELLCRSVILSVISGLCLALSQRQVSDPNQRIFERELVKRFAHESRLDGNPVHMCRALAMEASYFSRIGDFSRALDAQHLLEGIYSFDLYSSGICNEYGHDFAAQSFSDSVLWYLMVGKKSQAKKQIDFVVKNHLPKVNPRNVDTTMSLVYPLLMAMKELQMAECANTILQKFVAGRSKEFGCSLDHWWTLYKPILYLLQVARMDETHQYNREALDEIESWTMAEGASFLSPAMQRNGCIVIGEICWRIARRKHGSDDSKLILATIGVDLLASVLREETTDMFITRQAEEILTRLNGLKEKPQGRRGSMRLSTKNVFSRVKSSKKVARKSMDVSSKKS